MSLQLHRDWFRVGHWRENGGIYTAIQSVFQPGDPTDSIVMASTRKSLLNRLDANQRGWFECIEYFARKIALHPPTTPLELISLAHEDEAVVSGLVKCPFSQEEWKVLIPDGKARQVFWELVETKGYSRH